MAEDLPATGRAGGRRLKLLLGVVGLCVLASWVFVRVSSAQGIAEVSFDPAQKFQTIRGWEATVDVLWAPEYDPHREEILDRMISEVGITRLRVEAFSGDENRSRSFERFLSGEIDMQGWRDLRYATVNDDDDPYHITWEGFDFADLDWRMEKTALPLMERAKARGEKIEITQMRGWLRY